MISKASRVSSDMLFILLFVFLASVNPGNAASVVQQIVPRVGSTQGATRLSIEGTGFSKDPFSFGTGNEDRGNRVLLVNTTAAIECDVVAYWSNEVKIVCDTRAATAGDYALLLYVDGIEISTQLGGSYCKQAPYKCQFRYISSNTPTVESVSAMYGTPGSKVNIRGRIFTDKFAIPKTEEDDPSTADDPLEIQRVYWGNYICNLVDPETEELYGITLDPSSWGNIILVPQGTFIESQKFTFLISGPYGRCRVTPESLRVSGQNKLYNYQTHAEITRIEPTSGSLAGGTHLTISGNYFYELADTTVQVGGVPCNIKSISDTAIQCVTNKAPEPKTAYPGSRGILWERWFDGFGNASLEEIDLDSIIASCTSSLLADSASTPYREGESIGRLRGYFVPPRDGDYRFRIRGNGQALLFIRLNEIDSDMNVICESPSSSADWLTYPEQNSTKLPLLGGTPYYIEARYRKGIVEVGVDMFDVPVPAGRLEGAINEKQRISITTTVQPEIQTFRAIGVYEMQRIIVKYDGCDGTPALIGSCHPTEVFYLTYDDGTTTDAILVGSSADILASELSRVTSIPVSVTREYANMTYYNYAVTFKSEQDLPMLTSMTSDSSLVDIKISEIASGQAVAGNTDFVIYYGGEESKQVLSTDSTVEEVNAVFADMFGVECLKVSDAEPLFMRTYDYPLVADEWGERVVDPYCGRISIMNPTFIFYADWMMQMPQRQWVRSYITILYPKLCFAIKGVILSTLNIQLEYSNTKRKDVTNSDWYEIQELVDLNGYSATWEYVCIDIHTVVTTQGWIKDDVRRGRTLTLLSIAFEQLTGDDKMFIDNVFIGEEEDRYHRIKLPATPNGNFITDFEVAKVTKGFTVTLTPSSCGHNFPLIGFRNAATVYGSAASWSDEVVYSSDEFAGGTSMSVTRGQSASHPPGGMLQLEQDGIYTTVPATASAQLLKDSIESGLDSGTVIVDREGNCNTYAWDIEWTSKGGSQPLLQINKTGLAGSDVSTEVTRLIEGYLLMGPIPGEFLRPVYDQPQVEVMVNHIPSICAVNALCSFTYSNADTPIVTSVNPTSGSDHESTSISIFGSGFSTQTSDNIVLIGASTCDVTSTSDTSIVCDLGPGQSGRYLVDVNVRSKGSPIYPNGNITFDYNAGITDINPSIGSTAGGTQVTISGYGFPCDEDYINVNVAVGSQICRILSICHNEVICKITLDSTDNNRRKRGTSVDISITVDDILVATGVDAFTFDDSLTATITSISPTHSSVMGGGNLVITGTGFGSSGAVVTIGDDAECDVISQTGTEVVCAIPSNTPGLYHIELSIENSGFADASSISQFQYKLSVTSMFPDMGSLHGGSLVTIAGEGFGNDSTKVRVHFGDVGCEIASISDDEIECVTKPPVRVKYIDNQGIQEEFGRGYKWKPQSADIIVGDIVYWKWFVPTYVTGMGYTVQQTANADATAYDGTGFHGGTKKTQGTYAYKFTAPGTYYYSSGPVNSLATLFMKGQIRVSPKPSFAQKLTVSVGKYEAIYDKQIGLQPTEGSCPHILDPHPGCNSVRPSGSDGPLFYFSFWDCVTPIITSISPNLGIPSTAISIRGYGFGTEACQNKILINEYECVAQITTGTHIECVIDVKSTFQVSLTFYTVSLNVLDKGDAINEDMTPKGRAFRMVPSITAITQVRGSMAGGTRMTIFGDGFAPRAPRYIGVNIGGAGCVIEDFDYEHITCVTSKPSYQLSAEVVVAINGAGDICGGWCDFTYDWTKTPVVTYVTPLEVSGKNSTLTIQGDKFGNDTSNITVTVSGVDCAIMYVDYNEIVCNIGSYVPVGDALLIVNNPHLGDAHFVNESYAHLWSVMEMYSITPTQGSAGGGQLITLTGSGFHVGNTVVRMSGSLCAITTMNISSIQCITPQFGGPGDPIVGCGIYSYPSIAYAYGVAQTPQVDAVVPASGRSGEAITIQGLKFSADMSENTVTIDGVDCPITESTSETIICRVGVHSAGTYVVVVYVQGLGYAISSTEFEYEIEVTSATPGQGSFGGGPLVEIVGSGFDSVGDTAVSVCGNNCPIINITSSHIVCDVPSNDGTSDTLDCDITVILESGAIANNSNVLWQYRRDMTPVIESVHPSRGGTGGGTTMTITGTGFNPSGNKVFIAGTECTIQSESSTVITCRTGAHKPSEKTKVRVEVGNNGIATQHNASYYYVDVWSSRYTWGGLDPPIEGDFVIVPTGQTLMLDTDTPTLKMLLIDGGNFIFDEADITLNAEHILLMKDGLFQVGTEEEPFQHKANIVLHGHVRSKELPMYGAKTLAVRHGTLELHGKPIPVTWTHLNESVGAGNTTITLKKSVTWNVGDQIVLATTGHRHSMMENEMLTITEISADGHTLTFTPPVKYDHLGIEQTIGGVTMEMRAEVGLLTRNVVVRGSVNEAWTEKIEACEEEYDSSQFAIQTCFQGRFGEEVASDEFGAQIMLFAKQPHRHWSTGHIEYTEVTHAGQAFRLGRYPIHFHLNGDVTGNYVRGCAIHHTFNRAITIHAVHNLLVEHNVVFSVMGHAFFLEDGIETKNILQYNLAVFVRPSTSLLNTDINPAAFWIRNPDNYVRHNAAAGGSHVGFWYNAPQNPGGPSFNPNYCPRAVPLLEFRNNTCHSHGRYGLWIYPFYMPMSSGQCSDPGGPKPAEFYGLTAWQVERGVEGVELGDVRFIEFLIADAEKAGVEIQTVVGEWGGPMLKDSVIIGWSVVNEATKKTSCTQTGIQLPQSKSYTVDGATLINFDEPRCAAIRACAYCKALQGGFQSRFRNITFVNSPNRTRWQWEHECWFEDLDGSLTGQNAGYSVLPYNPNLPPDHCTFGKPEYGTDSIPGAICDDTVKFHRFAFNEASPASLEHKVCSFINEHGTSRITFKRERLTHPSGWMITLVDASQYNMVFQQSDYITDIHYAGRLDDFYYGDYVLLGHNFTQIIDGLSIYSHVRWVFPSSENPLTFEDNLFGQWYNRNNRATKFSYMVCNDCCNETLNIPIEFYVYRCHYAPCSEYIPETVPPPTVVVSLFNFWSDPETWRYATHGWGGFYGNGEYGLPRDGDDVLILEGMEVIADTDFPVMNKLVIYGTLELLDNRDYNLTATYIVIRGGHLIIGKSMAEPFQHKVVISLIGHHYTAEMPLPTGPNLGSKVLACFGGLDLHGKNHIVYWTHLATTAYTGDNTIAVMKETDWVKGDEIVVTTTSYETWDTETFTIERVIDSKTFVLNGSFQHKHIAEGYNITTDDNFHQSYSMRAEVGLLTRNIKIEGAYYDEIMEQSYGARVIVGKMYQNSYRTEYRGYARISNVEFFHSGQEGWTEDNDPRFSIAFLDTGVVNNLYPSYVKGCSFHNGFSTAIGLIGAHFVPIHDNVIHHTVGPGVKDVGTGNKWYRNLVSLVIFPGTYMDRYEGKNIKYPAGFEVVKSTKTVLIGNVVAGSERVGYNIGGEPCWGNRAKYWKSNTAHGTLHGVRIFRDSVSQVCIKVAGFTVYKSFDFGIYIQVHATLIVSNVILIDNKAAFAPLIIGPSARNHKTSDQQITFENSLIIATSPGFDPAYDDIEPESSYSSKRLRGPRSGHQRLDIESGNLGLLWPSFMTDGNLAPVFPFHWVMDYPTLSGKTLLNNVTFSNFGPKDIMIMSNPSSGDFMHPIYSENIHMKDVQNKLLIQRPNLVLVNPGDCVDMDCDGKKKAMLHDLDGSLLGSIGTVIPDSAYEWDGDPRRGLGDYRIPKVMVTEPDGSRIQYEDKMPNKGIYRGHNDECVWQPSWTAYECHGIEFNVMVIESLDDDSEVRRLSPVGLYTDTYVDLINGPQDMGWCKGYTCQERISTFYSIVALNKEYELVFTSTNPQNLRFMLLNAAETEKVVVGTWYSNPQRLDVYVDGVYIMPTNGAYENGEFVWKNDLSPEQYKPSVDSNYYGVNFFDRDTQFLYVLVHGAKPIIIRTTPVVMVTFGVPAVAVDEFYEVNLIANLVGFLNVEASQIRIVDIIAEDSLRRRRRGAGEAEVVIEIGDPPASTIETPEDEVVMTTANATVANATMDNVTMATPTTTNMPETSSIHSHAEHSLDFNALVDLQSTLANEMQQGSLASSLDIQITSMAMTDPEPVPVDPMGGERASNETGGASNGTERFDEHLAHLEAESEEAESAVVVYRIPVKLVLYNEPREAVEHDAFDVQPKIKVLDATDTLVEHLGTRSNPWLLEASIRPGTGSNHASLHGNTTLPFTHGWVNFTGLIIDHSATDYILDFAIVYPEIVSLQDVSTAAFPVAPRTYFAVIETEPPGILAVNELFDIVVEVRDSITGETAEHFAGKGFTWQVVADIYMPSNYQGQLNGNLNATFNISTAQAHLSDLSIDAFGHQYIVEVHVSTIPSSINEFVLQLDPFDVLRRTNGRGRNATESTLTFRFDGDYNAVVGGREDLMAINFINTISPMYPNVTISNVNVTRGSILISFDIEGSIADIEDTQDQMWDDLSDGLIVLNFNGFTLTADPFLLIDGEVFDPEDDDESYEDEESSYEDGEDGSSYDYVTPAIPNIIPRYQSLLPLWTVAAVVVNGILILVIFVWYCYKCECSKYDQQALVYIQNHPSRQNINIQTQQRAPLVKKPSIFTAPERLQLHKKVTNQKTPEEKGDINQDGTKTLKSCIKLTHPPLPEQPSESEAPTSPKALDDSPVLPKAEKAPPAPAEIKPLDLGIFRPKPSIKSLDRSKDKDKHEPKKMYIMAKSSTGIFRKVTSVTVEHNATIYDLRQSITNALSGGNQGKKFMLLMETLSDILESKEKKLIVSHVYSSDCVLIRWVKDDKGTTKTCMCGREGQFYCKICHKQAYCSNKCQTRYWPRHEGDCSKLK